MEKLKIEYLPIGDLVPYENNPRRNEEAVEYVARSIKQFGFKNPIIIDKENVIVAGHTRLLAAKQLNMESVPCIRATDLSEEKIAAFRLADNRVAEMASWDYDKLMEEIDQIEGIDIYQFGFFNFGNIDTFIDDEMSSFYSEDDFASSLYPVTFEIPIEKEDIVKGWITKNKSMELAGRVYE